MKLKAKPNLYEVIYSFKKAPDQWASFRAEEQDLQMTIMQVMSHIEWQLECVALIATSKSNRYELPTEK
jgi:hypothetical protein